MTESLACLVRTCLAHSEAQKEGAKEGRRMHWSCKRIDFGAGRSGFTHWGSLEVTLLSGLLFLLLGRATLICKSCFGNSLKSRMATALPIEDSLQGLVCPSSICILPSGEVLLGPSIR